VGEIGFFSSWSLFSSPSTRLSKASSISVLGPRFLGTASAEKIRQCRWQMMVELTVDAGALEDLAGLAAGA